MKILSRREQQEFVEVHLPHRLAILAAPFERTAELSPSLREAVMHGSFVAYRSLMDFMGLKDDRTSTIPRLIRHSAKNEDVCILNFGLPIVAASELAPPVAELLAKIYRVANKAVAHLTFGSDHPVIDLAQYHQGCSVLCSIVQGRLLRHYPLATR